MMRCEAAGSITRRPGHHGASCAALAGPLGEARLIGAPTSSRGAAVDIAVAWALLAARGAPLLAQVGGRASGLLTTPIGAASRGSRGR